MANYQNHVIDPSFFYDAIEQFAFDYDIYVVVGETFDDYGNKITQFEKQTIRGSLQTNGLKIHRSKHGNRQEMTYDFYCKSLYRIEIGDFINYKNKWLYVNGVHEYDEYGVRSATLQMIELANYRDLQAYIKYLEGVEIV